ncbi:hypothetical protein DMUE_0608 [Dictyocoela muelleri]|nr:hypothetical protein DMUE_0608 [Dictyocoela muelleri]
MGKFENVSILSECNYWIMDGTFHVAPYGFEQLYVIQSKILNVNTPIIYILMKHRTSEDYDNVFQQIKLLTDDTIPKNIIIDFESVVIAFLKRNYPSVQLNGYIFHFGQAIWRKICKEGLNTAYLTNHFVSDFF